MMLYRSSYLKTNDVPRKPGNGYFGTEFHFVMRFLCRVQNGLKRFLGMFSFLIERLFVCIWIITQIHFDDEQGDEQYWISSQT